MLVIIRPIKQEVRGHTQYFQKTFIWVYGTTTPLNKQKITKKHGRMLLMTVKLGAQAQIHWPQLDWNRKNSSVMRKT